MNPGKTSIDPPPEPGLSGEIPSPSPQPTPNSGKAVIFLVEDDPDLREYTERLLRKRYEVRSFNRGERALDAALASPPDTILSDIKMPGLDGYGLLKKLRADERTSGVPVLLVSVLSEEEFRLKALEAGANDYLIKPFSNR